MKVGPFDISLRGISRKADAPGTLSSVDNRGGWRVLEPYGGAWQQNVEWSVDTVLAFHAVFACITLIAADIGKLKPKLQQLTADGIWIDATSAAFSPVLKKPNRYQNHIQFKEWWINSKLLRGNAYALKQRDARGLVTDLYLLDPSRVTPKVTTSGDIYYELQSDYLAGVTIDTGKFLVPASEIIHDRMNCLFHPLVGLSPIFACGLSATEGLAIQRNQAGFFRNNSSPGGVLLAPGQISDATALRLKEAWETNYTGKNAGRVAVLGDGLKFEPMRMSATDSQLIEQLEMTAATVCSTFHVPGFMIGVGAEPAFANGETRTQHYYSQCLQTLIESFELCMDEGLGLDSVKSQTSSAPVQYGVVLDLDALLRMDMSALVETLSVGVKGGLFTPNEGRKRLNLSPLTGGDTVYMQVQNYSIEALAKRDATNPLAGVVQPLDQVPPGGDPAAAPAAPPTEGSPTGASPPAAGSPPAKEIDAATFVKFAKAIKAVVEAECAA